MPDPWTTSASASLARADGIVTLVEGSAFCISSRSGEIDPAHPQGLFFRDTRFLSEMHLLLNGVTPEPLAATAADPFSGVFVLRADFADVFEVKEGRIHKQGQLSVEAEGSRLTFRYRRHSFERATHIDFSEPPRFVGPHVTYETVVPPRGRWSACIEVTPVIGDQEVTP